MRTEILLLYLGMMLVTFIPRALPVFILEKFQLSGRAEKFLRLIPYTAMAALIFPGILSVDPGIPLLGAVGGLVAILVAWLKPSVPLVVLLSVLANVLMYTLGVF